MELLILFLGPFVGSFMALVADRYPREEDVVWTRSHCRACGTVLGVVDLIPVVSFLAMQGRCRHCGAPIPRFTLLAEVLGFFCGLWAVLGTTNTAEAILAACFLWCLLGLALTDWLHFVLPDWLNAVLFIFAMTLPSQDPQLKLLGAVLGAGSFALIRVAYQRLRGREGLGMGDVKLMAGLGAFTGPFALPLLALIAALLTLAAALVLGRTHRHAAMPFGVALCVAAALLWATDLHLLI